MEQLSDEALDSLIDAYALDALEPAEMEQIEAYIAQSSHAQTLYEQSQRVVAALAWTPTQVNPPTDAYTRFVQRVGVKTPLVVSAIARRPTFWHQLQALFTPQGRWVGALTLLLLFGVLGLGSWNLVLRQQVSGTTTSVNQYQELTALLAYPTTRLVALRSANNSIPNAGTQVVINVERDEGFVIAAGLAPLPDHQTYQLWLISDGKPVSMSIFDVDSEGKNTQLIRGLPTPGATNLLGITVEPSGGSTQPTSAPILVGDL